MSGITWDCKVILHALPLQQRWLKPQKRQQTLRRKRKI